MGLAERGCMAQRGSMRTLAACACLALIANPGTAAAKPLAPAGRWVVDFGHKGCVAQRTFGEANRPVYLLIKAPAVGEQLQISIAEKGPNGDGVQENARLIIGTGMPIPMSQLRYGVDKKQVRRVNLTKAQIDQFAGATQLRWNAKHLDYEFPLGSMTNLIKLLEQCRTGLAAHWNGTADKLSALRSGPQIDLRQIFSSDDYPYQAIRKAQAGMAHVVALVDEKGEMADCTVVETSGVAVLDAQTCIMIRKRGRFSPAIGPDGQPTKGVFSQRVRWEMP